MKIKTLLLAAISGIALFASCKKATEPILESPKTPVTTYTFVSTTSDPYNGTRPSTGRSYMFLKARIMENNTFNYYPVYTNTNGEAYSDEKKIYYNSAIKQDSLKFGSKVQLNVKEFRDRINQKIVDQGWVLLSLYSGGGAEYRDYELINISGKITSN